MAYGSKTKYRRRYARKGRVARMAKGKDTGLQSLAKAVRGLQRKVRGQHQYLNYVQSGSQTNLSSDVGIFNLTDFASMAPVFGTAADDGTNQRVVHQSFGFDGYISLENLVNNEEDTITFTMFLVSLKDDIGSAFNPSTGVLTMTALQHYYSQNGLVMLNKKCFNIHKRSRFVLTNHGTNLNAPSAQTQYGTDKRFYWKCTPRSTITNPTGNWPVLRSGLDPSKSYYLLVFNDNSSADLESPCITWNCVHTMKTIV